MNTSVATLSRLLVHLLLLPFLLFWVPVMFAMAWAHEVFEDLRPARLRPAPAYMPVPSGLPSLTRVHPYR